MSKASKVHKDSKVMASLLSDDKFQMRQFKPGDLVEGTVVSVSHGEVLMDLGAKSEGIISGNDLIDSDNTYKNIKAGDTLLATVLQAENDQGYIVLSLRYAERERKWREARQAYDTGAVLEATVLEYNKGGLLCDCIGLRGFIPLSHLDRVHFAEDISKVAGGSDADLKETLSVLSGKTLKVKVIELDPEKNRFVLSEKEAAATYSAEARENRLAEIKVNDKLTGIVTGVMPFGVFVDLDGVEGLVHISEIAWEKVNHPSNYFKVGQSIEVLVLGIDDKNKKLALSVKRLTPNPWETVDEKYPVGTKVSGTISKVVPFGAFMTLEKGLDGLIHISETTGPLEEGQEVEAIVTQVDGANQKLALSIRKLDQEPVSIPKDAESEDEKESSKDSKDA